ncbi:MAG TPA: ABC transporter ATP-binding protein [Nitrospira sp.]|nr:ABC transporter ATP-binding protein [Nitrospira sp.]HQV11046.1 ABC transporter ATP-binding protein [Nitrospira sp.]
MLETSHDHSPLPRAGLGDAAVPLVGVQHVSKEYRRGETILCALQDVTLEVKAGEFCAFVGPSGCGKSTLLNLIGGLDQPTSGTIMIEGRPVTDASAMEWTRLRRELIGIVFQAFHLIPGLTVAENVALPMLLKGEQGRSVADRIDEVLQAVGMGARRSHRPSELSGGEQQRVAIARAIVHRPRLILADEPTGNLDSKQGADIISLFRTLPRRFGHSVLLVTHSESAAEAADYVWHMRDGRLINRITH